MESVLPVRNFYWKSIYSIDSTFSTFWIPKFPKEREREKTIWKCALELDPIWTSTFGIFGVAFWRECPWQASNGIHAIDFNTIDFKMKNLGKYVDQHQFSFLLALLRFKLWTSKFPSHLNWISSILNWSESLRSFSSPLSCKELLALRNYSKRTKWIITERWASFRMQN